MRCMSVSICFVCLGNICRSPTAEGIMRHEVAAAKLSDAIAIDSAGTGAWHVGERADARSRAAARRRGVELTSIARRFEAVDFERFDYVVAMDRSNRNNLVTLAPGPEALRKISLLRSYGEQDELDVPDPYFEDNFELVFDICQLNCRALLAHVRAHHDL